MGAMFRLVSVATSQDASDRLVHPGIDLQVAIALGCEPQLYAAIGTYVSHLGVASRILHGDFQEPMGERSQADLTLVFH